MRFKKLLAAWLFYIPALNANPLTVALNWHPEAEFGGFYAAQFSGYFNEEGLKVDLLPGGAGQPVIPMLASGKVDFAIGRADDLLIARANGIDIVALFAEFQTYPQAIMVHKSTGILSLAEIFTSGKIKQVSLEPGSAFVQFLENKYGFQKVKIVPYFGGLSRFINNETFAQQSYIHSEPLIAKREKQNPNAFLIADSEYNPYCNIVIARKKFIEENKATVDKVIHAITKGWQDYLQDPAKTNAELIKLNPSLTLAFLTESARAMRVYIENPKGLGKMESSRWQTMANQLEELHLLKRPINPEKAFLNPQP